MGIRFRTANKVAKMVTSSKGTPTDDTMDTLASLVGHGVQKPYCSKYLGKHTHTTTTRMTSKVRAYDGTHADV